MASEITYAEVRFKNESKTSGANLEPPEAPEKKTSPQKSSPGLPKQLFASLLILLLLLAVSCFISFIIYFQRYSQLLEEKKNLKEAFHKKMACEETNLIAEDILLPNTEKVWGCCPENWIAVTTSCYFIILDANSWNDSEKKCTEMGTHLMVVNTQEEQKLIVKKLQLKKDSAYYVGLSDPEGKHQWQWIDQSPYDKDAILWHDGEPSENREHCVFLNHRHREVWGLNNAVCEGKQKAICEMKRIYL